MAPIWLAVPFRVAKTLLIVTEWAPAWDWCPFGEKSLQGLGSEGVRGGIRRRPPGIRSTIAEPCFPELWGGAGHDQAWVARPTARWNFAPRDYVTTGIGKVPGLKCLLCGNLPHAKATSQSAEELLRIASGATPSWCTNGGCTASTGAQHKASDAIRSAAMACPVQIANCSGTLRFRRQI